MKIIYNSNGKNNFEKESIGGRVKFISKSQDLRDWVKLYVYNIINLFFIFVILTNFVKIKKSII